MPVVINGTSGITDVDGTAAAPALTGTDTDTGVYFGTNTIGLSTNGVAALSIDASQNTTLAGTLTTSAKGIAKASLPAGSVLQVVQTAYTTVDSTTSAAPSSMASTGCTASITPSASTNKILVMLSMPTFHSSAAMEGAARIMRGTSAAFSGIAQDYYTLSGTGITGNINIQWLDSPATTSSVTYTAQFGTYNGGTLSINKDFNGNNNGVTYLTLMEISA